MFKEKKRHLINLTLKISLAVFIVLILITVYFFEQKKKSQEEYIYEIGKNYLNITSDSLSIWFFNQLKIAQLISEDLRVIAAVKNPENIELVKEAHDFLQEINRKSPHYENLPIVSFNEKEFEILTNGEKKIIKKGTFITDTAEGRTVGKGGMEYSFIREIYKGKDYYISQAYPSILRKKPIFVLSVPIKENGKVIGAAGVSPKLDFFTKSFIDNIKHDETGYIFCFDDRYLIISHPDRSLMLDDSENFKNQAKSIIENLKDNKEFFKSTFGGISKYYVVSPLSINGGNIESSWYLCFTQNIDEVLKPAYQLLELCITGSLIFSLLISACVYVIGKSHIDQAEKEILRDSNLTLEEKIKERTKSLQKKAITDSLTGLFNHRHSLRELNKNIRDLNIKNITVIMSDLDNFKQINDTYGHPIGDRVLAQFSKIIKSNIRSEDVVGRYGGEEFIIILVGSELKAGIEVAERIRTQLSQHKFKDIEGNITSSFGVYQWNGEETNLLVKKADDLLYKAKIDGRNCTKSLLDS